MRARIFSFAHLRSNLRSRQGQRLLGPDIGGSRLRPLEVPLEVVQNADLSRVTLACDPVGVLKPRVNALESRAFLSGLVASSQDPIIGKTLDGTIVLWNQAAEDLYGYTNFEILGRSIAVLIPPDRVEELSYLLDRVQAGEIVRNFQTKRLRKNGTTVDVAITVSPVAGPDGLVLGGSTITHDLSLYNQQIIELREAHRSADEAISTLATLQARAPVGFGFVDTELRLTHLNEMLASLSGSTTKELLGRHVADVVPELWTQVEPIYRRVLENGESINNIEIIGEVAGDPGHRHHWLASYYPVHLKAEIIGVGIVVIDVTERRQAEEFRTIAMSQMAEGLFTVDAQGCLTSMNESATQMLGWTEDELCGKVMSCLVLADNEDDPFLDEGNAELLKVRAEGKHVQLDDHAYRCKNGSLLSVAISASPIFIGGTVEGAVIVFRDITQEKSEGLRISRELAALSWVGRIREALDEGRFVLFSQLITPLAGGQPSEELLLRMVGRNGEFIAPGAFMNVAEKYGLITEIDQWVIRQAFGRAAAGHHVGINVSAESITTLDLVELIQHEIQETGADTSNVVFEITETALMRDISKGEAFARGVVDLGCAVSLDDFGTGFGSFTYLKKLPISYLKIDIEFVRDLATSSANQHVVKAIVTLARGFGCQTIAEGVEDEETLNLLRDYGVDFAQGFYIGRPKSCAC
jgi:PAS domain S-box-containing protein